jgi:hypothetical protein
MSFSSLSGRLKDLPLVLAGPILLQVTESKVSVWFALKGKATVTLLILDEKKQRVMGGTANTTPVGVALHVVAVTATILPPSMCSGRMLSTNTKSTLATCSI